MNYYKEQIAESNRSKYKIVREVNGKKFKLNHVASNRNAYQRALADNILLQLGASVDPEPVNPPIPSINYLDLWRQAPVYELPTCTLDLSSCSTPIDEYRIISDSLSKLNARVFMLSLLPYTVIENNRYVSWQAYLGRWYNIEEDREIVVDIPPTAVISTNNWTTTVLIEEIRIDNLSTPVELPIPNGNDRVFFAWRFKTPSNDLVVVGFKDTSLEGDVSITLEDPEIPEKRGITLLMGPGADQDIYQFESGWNMTFVPICAEDSNSMWQSEDFDKECTSGDTIDKNYLAETDETLHYLPGNAVFSISDSNVLEKTNITPVVSHGNQGTDYAMVLEYSDPSTDIRLRSMHDAKFHHEFFEHTGGVPIFVKEKNK